MLNYLLSLTFLFSAEVHAQHLVLTEKPRSDLFQPKAKVGYWGTETSKFNHDHLRGGFSPEELLPESLLSPEVGCNKEQTFLLSRQQRQNLVNMSAPFNAYQCLEAEKVKDTKQLNPEVCLLLANCYKSKTVFGEGNYDIMRKAREKTASEAVALMSTTTINQMYELEELKAFTKEKYNDEYKSTECLDDDSMKVPLTKADMCMTNVIDNGYELAQKNCNLLELGCHPDYLEFTKDKKTENTKTSLMAQFIKEKSKKMADIYLVEETSITQEIATIITKKELSAEARSRAVMDFMASRYTSLDPVYKSYMKQSIRNKSLGVKDDIYEGIYKYIKTNGNRNTLEIMGELDLLRRKEAGRKLAESCHQGMTVAKLCTIVKDVVGGAEVQVPRTPFEKLMKIRISPNSNIGSSKQDLADNVSRCNTFAIDASIGKNGNAAVRLSNGLDLISTGYSGLFMGKGAAINGVSTADTLGQRAQFIVKANGDVSKKENMTSSLFVKLNSVKEEKSTDTILVSKFSNNLIIQESKRPDMSVKPAALSKIETVDFKGRVTSDSDENPKSMIESNDSVSANSQKQSKSQAVSQAQIGQQSMVNQKNLYQPESRSINTIIDNQNDFIKNEPPAVKAKVPAPTADYTYLMNKIAGLEDKLASQKKPAFEAQATEPKDSEESELSRELRMAKASIAEITNANKEAKIKNNASTTSVASAKPMIKEEEYETEVSPTIAISGPSNKESRPVTAQAAQSPASSVAGSGSSSAGGDRSPASIESSGPTSFGTNSSSGGDNNSSSGSDGLVLTRLDGVSRSKASETISRMIIAESGKPFYIEEGGLVKEIIPQIVDGEILKDEDGSPIYKTIVKGKIGVFKIDEKGKRTKVEVGSKTISPADVKIQDNKKLSSPAVRYKELQEILKIKK